MVCARCLGACGVDLTRVCVHFAGRARSKQEKRCYAHIREVAAPHPAHPPSGVKYFDLAWHPVLTAVSIRPEANTGFGAQENLQLYGYCGSKSGRAIKALTLAFCWWLQVARCRGVIMLCVK